MHLFNLIEIEIVLVESTHFVSQHNYFIHPKKLNILKIFNMYNSQHDCEFRFFAGLHDCLNDPWRMVPELIPQFLLMNLP